MKRIIIVHGWEGGSQLHWMPWLKEQLEGEIIVPDMPNTEEPEINTWVSHLADVVGDLDENTYFVAHSIGCQTVLRYLAQANKKCGGCLFVGGWFTLTGLEGEETETIAKPWLETPIEYEDVLASTKNIRALFSDDDPFVPVENVTFFKERLHATTRTEHGKGHFTGEEYPEILEEAELILEQNTWVNQNE